jgi:transposase InsO family protein
MKNKDDQVPILVSLIKRLKAKYGYTVKYIRCDNAGENVALQKACEAEGFGITFEFTSPSSPQFNGRVERRFPTHYNSIRSSLNAALLPDGWRQLLWAEAGNNVNKVMNVLL